MPTVVERKLKPLKCESCSKVLMFIDIKEGIVSKDCPKCGHRNIVVFEDTKIKKVEVNY